MQCVCVCVGDISAQKSKNAMTKLLKWAKMGKTNSEALTLEGSRREQQPTDWNPGYEARCIPVNSKQRKSEKATTLPEVFLMLPLATQVLCGLAFCKGSITFSTVHTNKEHTLE